MVDDMRINRSNGGARWRAFAAAALLLLAGAAAGVLVDRLLLMPREAEAMPLTTRAMAARLDLDPAAEARMRALLDSMHAEVTAAAQHGPDSLAAAARRVHLRVEAALPPDARPAFRVWMHEQHRQLMRHLGRGSAAHGARHP